MTLIWRCQQTSTKDELLTSFVGYSAQISGLVEIGGTEIVLFSTLHFTRTNRATDPVKILLGMAHITSRVIRSVSHGA